MSGVTGGSGTALPLLSFAQVPIRRRKTRKKEKNERREKSRSARGTPRQ